MNLGELITTLEAADPDQTVQHGFATPYYLNDYTNLAFEPSDDTTIGAMLAAARSAMGATFQNGKGGEHTMDANTWCWLSHKDDTSCETISPQMLAWMVMTPPAAAAPPPATRTDLRNLIAETLLTTRRTDYEGTADHRNHRYDVRCALCAFDVDALTDAVLRVLPDTDPAGMRVTVLLEGADAIDAETRQAKADGILEPDKYRPCRDASAQLRAMAGCRACAIEIEHDECPAPALHHAECGYPSGAAAVIDPSSAAAGIRLPAGSDGPHINQTGATVSEPTAIPGQTAGVRDTAYDRLQLLQQQVKSEALAAAGEFRALLRAMWPDAACLVLCDPRRANRFAPSRVITAGGTILWSFYDPEMVFPQAPECAAPFAGSDGLVSVHDLTTALRNLYNAGLDFDILPPQYGDVLDENHARYYTRSNVSCLLLSPDDTVSSAADS